MASTDLEQLLDMGFEKQRAEMAVKSTGGCLYISRQMCEADLMADIVFSARSARMA
jgi:UBA/TS-N domain